MSLIGKMDGEEIGWDVWRCIQQGSLERVKEFFPEDGSKTPNVVLFSWGAITPLFLACREGKVEIAAYLIGIGADVSFYFAS